MSSFEDLLSCYRSGQMTDAQMQQHMRDDPAFAAYVAAVGAMTEKAPA